MFETHDLPPASGALRKGVRVGIAIAVIACIALTAFLYFVSLTSPSRPGSNLPGSSLLMGGSGRSGRSGFRGGFGAGPPDLRVVKRFDKNGDGWLNATERRAAREFLSRQPATDKRTFGFNRAEVTPDPGARLSPAGVRVYGAEPLYDPSVVRTVFLEFEDADWEDELTAFYRSDVDVPATMTADGKKYKGVGVHFRGNSSFRMVPEGLKHSFNVSMDFIHEQQNLGGYRTLDLLNAHQDPTFVRSVLYSEVARHYLPAPKANLIRVVVNGEDWGIYTNQQAFNKDFLRDWFGQTGGARWKVPGSPRGRGGLEYLGDEVSSYRTPYELKSKDDPKAWADLIRLCKVLNSTRPDRLERELAPLLDIDGALRFLALDNALINNDGYWIRASDYSLYEDESGRFHVIPHDFNETFNDVERGRGFRGGGTESASGAELNPLIGLDDTSKPLRSKLLAVPTLRARYLGYVREIAERWLDWKQVGPIARRYQALIVDEVKTDTHKLYGFDEFDVTGTDETSLKGFVERRRAYLLRYLDK